jgi:hypothetical protein
MQQLILRVSLICVSITGLFAGFVIFGNWAFVVRFCRWFGIDLPSNLMTPYIEYLVFMSGAVSVMIGFLYLLPVIWPQRFSNLLPFLGGSLLFIGIVVTYHGIRLSLPPWPFLADPAVCFLFGSIILILGRTAYRQSAELPSAEQGAAEQPATAGKSE